MRLWPCWLLLVGCMPGPNAETLIDSLQVVSAINEPAEVAVMEPWELSLAVADPAGVSPAALVWSCLDDACETHPAALDEDGMAVLPMTTTVPVPLWVMACDPGVCDLQDPTPAQLADPLAWMAELPIDGVSLALQPVRLTELAPEERGQNPLVETAPDPAVLNDATVDTPAVLSFQVPGATTAWGYSTAGGFGRPSWDVASDGAVELEWFAERKSEGADVFVVFVDDQGGQALWTARWAGS